MNASRTLCTLLLCFTLFTGVNAQSYYHAESFLYSFEEGRDMFLADYGDNAYWLQRMNTALQVSRVQLLGGEFHLLIVAHVGAYNYEEEAVINEASLRASRIRAYIKSKLNIPHECIAFYIDRSGSYRNQVHVYQVHMPLPWFANLEISCSESRYPPAIAEAITRYGSVPYVDLYTRGHTDYNERQVYIITDSLFDRSELDDYRLAISYSEKAETVARTPDKPVPVKQLASSVAEPVVQTIPCFVAVKTNLLPWMTVVPAVDLGNGGPKIERGSFMPNMEVEYYFARRWSVAVSALYSDFTYGGWEDNKWGLSDIMLSSRFWPLAKPGRYDWLSIGFYGQYGDFDVRGDKIGGESLYGRTGRFWSAGASVGCLVPLGSGFGLEAVVESGYRSVFGGKKYRYDGIDGKNYLESRFTSTGVRLGVKLNVLYRFRVK